MLTLTDKAAEKVFSLREQENITDPYLRVQVRGGGCAGFMYDLFFDSELTETDVEIEEKGIKLVMDMISSQYLDECVIDYVETAMGEGFKFNNSSAKSVCGCGSSFSV